MNKINESEDNNNCFVCGPDNPIGLQLKFRIENDICLSEFTPEKNHMGYENVTHGGIIFSVLDDVMANWLYLRGKVAFTAKCEIRYFKPVKFGNVLRLEGHLIKKKGKLHVLKGLAICSLSGDTLVETLGTFITSPKDS